jgi:nucleoside-diphosphate-sugar epimerase
VTVLVVGASGATGRLLTAQLLDRGQRVRIVVRAADRLSEELKGRDGLTVIEASLPDLPDSDLVRLTEGCHAVASCLGHTPSLRGIYGPPRRLVTDAVRRLCAAIRANAPEKPVRFVLMNTAGNRNRDLHEPVSLSQRAVLGLLRLLLPPHADNEDSADYLRSRIGRDDGAVEWVAVRPDGLIDAPAPSAYEVHPSPVRSAIFDAGTTSRANVAHFMAELAAGGAAWAEWKGRMPVIYDAVVP